MCDCCSPKSHDCHRRFQHTKGSPDTPVRSSTRPYRHVDPNLEGGEAPVVGILGATISASPTRPSPSRRRASTALIRAPWSGMPAGALAALPTGSCRPRLAGRTGRGLEQPTPDRLDFRCDGEGEWRRTDGNGGRASDGGETDPFRRGRERRIVTSWADYIENGLLRPDTIAGRWIELAVSLAAADSVRRARRPTRDASGTSAVLVPESTRTGRKLREYGAGL